jgi:CheY-like chemotaxis protein
MSHTSPLGQRIAEGDRVGQTILVIDDEPVMQGLLRDILSSEGYVVESAADGQDGLTRIAALKPDLVLLDLMMPVRDGWSVMRALKQAEAPPPIIVISAAVNVPEMAERALAAGARACFPKPFDLGALLESCREVIGPPGR